MPREALTEELQKLRNRYHHSTLSLSTFVRDSLKGIDKKRDTKHRILNELSEHINDDTREIYIEREDGTYLGLAKNDMQTMADALTDSLYIDEPHRRMLLEMSLVYACALFDALVTDIVITTFQHIPEALRSGRTLTTEEVLRFSSRERLIEELARREAFELMYKSVESQFRYFRTAFNIDIFNNQSLDVTIVDLAAVRERRNLIAHNNGLANASYIEKYCPSASIGDPVIADTHIAASDREVLRKVGIALIYSFRSKLA